MSESASFALFAQPTRTNTLARNKIAQLSVMFRLGLLSSVRVVAVAAAAVATRGPRMTTNHRWLASLNTNTNTNTTEISEQVAKPGAQQQQQQGRESPIRKLLRVKDYVDMVMFGLMAFGFYFAYKRVKAKAENEKELAVEWHQDAKMKHKMFKCAGFYLPEYTIKHLRDIKSFETRADDIFIVSFPKSGTTWIQELAYLITSGGDYDNAKRSSIEARSPFIDFPSPGIKHINAMQSPRLIKTHLPLTHLPDKIGTDGCKIIYIVRNPKDVCVSYYHFAKMNTQAEYTGSMAEFVDSFVSGAVPYGPWWEHVNEFTDAAAGKTPSPPPPPPPPQPTTTTTSEQPTSVSASTSQTIPAKIAKQNIHIVYYEELKSRPHETVRALATFLGKSPAQLSDADVDRLVAWCSFDAMRANASVNYEWYKELGLFKKTGNFFRQGCVGDWLAHFDTTVSKQFDERVHAKLTAEHNLDYGLSADDLAKIYALDEDKK